MYALLPCMFLFLNRINDAGYCCGVVSYKAFHALRLFWMCCAPHLSSNLSLLHPPELSALVAAETSSSEPGRNWARNGR
jgi:hypothetical protein